MELERKCPPNSSKDRGIARRCKLFLGTDLERGALVLEDPSVWPPMEPSREFAAANLQTESYVDLQNQSGDSARRYRPLVPIGMAYGLARPS
jgi:hypothetical protein